MTDDDNIIPSPRDLIEVPQLAMLTALANTLDLVDSTLVAAHDELIGDVDTDDPRLWLADVVLAQSAALATAIRRYRDALDAPRRRCRQGRLPF